MPWDNNGVALFRHLPYRRSAIGSHDLAQCDSHSSSVNFLPHETQLPRYGSQYELLYLNGSWP